MKDKMKSEKQSPIPGVDVVKPEPSIDVEFKKEPGLNPGLCDGDSKNTNICAKVGFMRQLPLIMIHVNEWEISCKE